MSRSGFPYNPWRKSFSRRVPVERNNWRIVAWGKTHRIVPTEWVGEEITGGKGWKNSQAHCQYPHNWGRERWCWWLSVDPFLQPYLFTFSFWATKNPMLKHILIIPHFVCVPFSFSSSIVLCTLNFIIFRLFLQLFKFISNANLLILAWPTC